MDLNLSHPIRDSKDIDKFKQKVERKIANMQNSVDIDSIPLEALYEEYNSDQVPWRLKGVYEDIKNCGIMGGKGVVVHVGTSKDREVEKALQNMKESLDYLLENNPESTPILLETPAGEGEDLCSTIEEFAQFYNRFSARQRKTLRICIDTCHVFAAGYDPLEYCKRWKTTFPDSLKLVHFNDSKGPRGCRVDRHEYPGLGYVGYDRLNEVKAWCVENSVDMVVE